MNDVSTRHIIHTPPLAFAAQFYHKLHTLSSVSYTHLTLPTIYSV